jgi:hypothetical protein
MEEASPGLRSNDGAASAQRGAGGRFAPGNRFGKGNPGARHRATVATEALLTKPADIKAITAAILREARQGAQWACMAWLKLVAPSPRGRLISFDMPTIDSASDIPGAIKQVAKLLTAGELTSTKAAEVVSIYDALRVSFEADAMAADLEDLKQRVATIEQPRWQ